jgi:hypothetical protein
LVKKGEYFDVPDGIIAPLTREYGGNVHDRQTVAITCGSLEKETQGANPHPVTYYNADWAAAKNAADLETDLISSQPIARKKRMFLTRGTIGCDTISGREGLCQLTTQSA